MLQLEPEPGQVPQRELQVCSVGGPEWTGSEQQACLRSAKHCSFAAVAVVAAAAAGAAAADFVEAASIAGLELAWGTVAAGRHLLPAAGVP